MYIADILPQSSCSIDLTCVLCAHKVHADVIQMTQEKISDTPNQERLQSPDLTEERGREDNMSMEGVSSQPVSSPTGKGEAVGDDGASKSFLKSVKNAWDKVPQAWGQQRTSKE